jgi:hypothetical protein
MTHGRSKSISVSDTNYFDFCGTTSNRGLLRSTFTRISPALSLRSASVQSTSSSAGNPGPGRRFLGNVLLNNQLKVRAVDCINSFCSIKDDADTVAARSFHNGTQAARHLRAASGTKCVEPDSCSDRKDKYYLINHRSRPECLDLSPRMRVIKTHRP